MTFKDKQEEFYIPEPNRLASQSVSNRQGRGTPLVGEEAAYVLTLLRDDAETAHKHYLELLNEETPGHSQDRERRGLARELARMNLTLNFYTQWYWKIDLHNFTCLSVTLRPRRYMFSICSV